MPGVSDNIRVRSVVGRFLEHSRSWWFGNDGEPDLFCASADWLERNLLRRVEVGFPILDPELAVRVRSEVLDNYLADNCDAWELQSDGSYVKCTPGGATPHSAQATLMEKLCT
jgi:polyphosphate kinase